MTTRLIPERTVDSLFAAEVALFLPTSLIWSPSNTRGQLDHQVFLPGARVLCLECKGIVSNAARDPARPWKAPIDFAQLTAYLNGPLPIHYLLPAKPGRPDKPWERPCTDPDYNGWCTSCSNVGLAVRRRWAGTDPLVKDAPIHWRFQPWFAHWCWVVAAHDLAGHLRTNGGPNDVSCADAALEAIGTVDRLCHFLARLADGEPDINAISIPAESLPALVRDDWPTLADPQSADSQETTALQFLYVPEQSPADGGGPTLAQ